MAIVNTDTPIITLTTDFGLEDNYIGIVKGIIAGLNPNARLIDITHQVEPFGIDSARYILQTAAANFTSGTIHLAVIDPTVGTGRRAILIETSNHFYIGPDNGLFSFLKKKEIKRIIRLENPRYFLKSISSTFQARDIFAPVAAYLSLGISCEEFGRKIKTIVRGTLLRNKKYRAGLIGHLIHIDHFGNLVTSFAHRDLPDTDLTILLNGRKVGSLKKTFASVRKGRPVVYINSFDYLEIGINCGSAAEYFSADCNSEVKILFADDQ